MKALEELITKAKGAVDVIGEKAGQFASVSKLSLKVIDMKAQLKHEFEELGKMVYENYGSEEESDSAIASQVQSIKELETELEKLKNQIAFMKNKILCKSCGNQNEVGALYCSKCGENLKKEGTPIVEEQENEDDDFVDFDD